MSADNRSSSDKPDLVLPWGTMKGIPLAAEPMHECIRCGFTCDNRPDWLAHLCPDREAGTDGC